MNRGRILIGALLAGVIGPALGISANADHMWGKIMPAVCCSLVGIAFILREVLASTNSRRA